MAPPLRIGVGPSLRIGLCGLPNGEAVGLYNPPCACVFLAVEYESTRRFED